MTKVIPSIKPKWIGRCSTPILIEQDYAKPNGKGIDKLIQAESKKDGWNIRMWNQQPNSSELNILDLGFSNAMQSLQAEKCALKIEVFVKAVEESFAEINPMSCTIILLICNRLFVKLSIMKEAMISKYLI